MSDTERTLWGLSRFFFADSAAAMRDAWQCFDAAPIVDDWDEVEFSFNKLFVGPGTLLAPPFASVYLDGGNRQVMGETTLRIRALYQMLGLVSPWLNRIPDDHLALELDALWQLQSALQKKAEPCLQDAFGYLLAHLQKWIPLLIARILSVEEVHPAIRHVSDTLLQTIRLDKGFQSY